MTRIYVDFNTLNSEPVGVVKLGQAGIDDLPTLHVNDSVVLYDEEFEVTARVAYDVPSAMWLASPIWSTRKAIQDASAIA